MSLTKDLRVTKPQVNALLDLWNNKHIWDYRVSQNLLRKGLIVWQEGKAYEPAQYLVTALGHRVLNENESK